MNIKSIICLTSLFYASNCFSIFCPDNFNQINIGDTLAEVEAQCGKPSTEKHFKTSPSVPQEWVYYVPIANMIPQQQNIENPGTMKVTFAFVNDVVVNMSSNGIGVGATTICNGDQIQPGATMKEVEDACGKPVSITKSSVPTGGTPPEETLVNEWKYGKTTLRFENGKLKERQ